MSLVFAKSSFTRAPGFTSNAGRLNLSPSTPCTLTV